MGLFRTIAWNYSASLVANCLCMYWKHNFKATYFSNKFPNDICRLKCIRNPFIRINLMKISIWNTFLMNKILYNFNVQTIWQSIWKHYLIIFCNNFKILLFSSRLNTKLIQLIYIIFIVYAGRGWLLKRFF